MKLYFVLIFSIFNSYAYHDMSIRHDSFPFVSGDTFRNLLANHIYDETNTKLNPEHIELADIIFIKAEYLTNFFQQIHPKVKNPYIILTHNSDLGIPGNFIKYLDDEKILMWFGQNPTTMYHPKFKPVPIGIANQYVVPHGNVSLLNKVLNSTSAHQKKILLGINFRPSTAPGIRNEIFKCFNKIPFCKNICSNSFEQYLKLMARAKFIISPPGNGLDCHRHWEAMLVKTIPIILTSCLDEILYDLPVLIVNSYSEVTENFLKKKYDEIMSIYEAYNLAKLYFPYWQNIIKSYQKEMRAGYKN